MADYISREAVKEKKVYLLERREFVVPVAEIDWLPAADMDAILAENDTMRKQLAQIGKKPGDKMEDVRTVVHGKWVRWNENRTSPIKDSYICSVCGEKTLSGFCGNPAKTNFCPNCGAEMITGKEEKGRT